MSKERIIRATAAAVIVFCVVTALGFMSRDHTIILSLAAGVLALF